MLSFIDWLRSRVIFTDDKEQAVLDKIAEDKEFPQSVCLWIMLDYMEKKYGKREKGVFETVYRQEYIKHITSSSKPT